ncbi:hypothetical protein CR513_56599, partial [Mucuna pruriens]
MKTKNLFQGIDRSTLETILNKDIAKSILDSLKKRYQGTMQLQKEFEMLKMKEGEFVNDYFSHILAITDKL